MLRTRIICFLLALGCAFWVMQTASAAETDCDSSYCFTQEDFSQEGLTGICITGLPQSHVGQLLLGDRALRPGDILTADQALQLTFRPVRTETDASACLTYLPIFPDRVAPAATVTVSIRGKEDLPPAAEDFALETYKNLPLEGRLKVTDPEGQALTYTVVRQPRRGNLTVNADGSFTYTPKKNKVGVDSFVYTATDPAGKVSRQATVTVTILKPTDATQYTDTVGLDCRFAAEWMKNTGIFTAEQVGGNACFGPELPVSRGQFLTMLLNTLELPQQEALSYDGMDGSVPQWLRPYAAAALRAGLTAGLPQESFDYNAPITGAEAAVLLQNALDLTALTEAAPEDSLPVWAADALTVLEGHGFDLAAQEPLTRAQAAQALYLAASLADNAPGMRSLRMLH